MFVFSRCTLHVLPGHGREDDQSFIDLFVNAFPSEIIYANGSIGFCQWMLSLVLNVYIATAVQIWDILWLNSTCFFRNGNWDLDEGWNYCHICVLEVPEDSFNRHLVIGEFTDTNELTILFTSGKKMNDFIISKSQHRSVRLKWNEKHST